MLEEEGLVAGVRPFDLHGVTYLDVEVTFPDGSANGARLGPEGAPDDLRAGERVLVTRAMNLIISVRRPDR